LRIVLLPDLVWETDPALICTSFGGYKCDVNHWYLIEVALASDFIDDGFGDAEGLGSSELALGPELSEHLGHIALSPRKAA